MKFPGAVALVLAPMLLTACDKMPLTAPRNSTLTMTSAATVLPAGGRTEVTAFVAESGQTPVQNGTVVRFRTNLGSVDPVETQTRNGMATTTFLAGDIAGEAEISAASGATTGGTSPATLKIKVGDAAIDALAVRAAPQFLPFDGGTSQITATVLGPLNRALSGVAVNFSTTRGSISESRVVTDDTGLARTTVTVSRSSFAVGERDFEVTAAAGTKTATVRLTRRAPNVIPKVEITAATESTVNALGRLWSFTATVTDTDEESRPTRYEWDFGDGTKATSTTGTVTHTFTQGGVVRTVTVRVSLVDGSTIEAAREIVVLALPVLP